MIGVQEFIKPTKVSMKLKVKLLRKKTLNVHFHLSN